LFELKEEKDRKNRNTSTKFLTFRLHMDFITKRQRKKEELN